MSIAARMDKAPKKVIAEVAVVVPTTAPVIVGELIKIQAVPMMRSVAHICFRFI